MDRALPFLLALSFLTAPAVLGADSSQISSNQSPTHLEPLSTTNLQRRLASIDLELQQLARITLRSGVGSVGFRSNNYPDPGHNEWIRIELGEEVLIDEIVLVPTIWRDTANGFRADGFPTALRIVAGTDGDTNGKVIARYGEEDRLLPRIAPLVVNGGASTASWIRVEATTLSSRVWDGNFVLQLSEILVFRGQENVALGKPVKVSSGAITVTNHHRFLVDTFG